MSNCYTQFSTRIPWQGAARAALLEKLRCSEGDDDASVPCDFAEQPEGIWLSSEASADLDALVALLVDVQSAFHLPPIGFEFSVSCSKPALDEFGGGAVVLKGGQATWLSTSTWLGEQLAAPSSASPSL